MAMAQLSGPIITIPASANPTPNQIVVIKSSFLPLAPHPLGLVADFKLAQKDLCPPHCTLGGPCVNAAREAG
jgi:hypothetical protein